VQNFSRDSAFPPDPGRGPSAILAERTQELQEMLDRAEARGAPGR